MHIPAEFREKVTGAFPEGAAWLNALPTLLEECSKRWSLTIGPPFHLSFNYVAPAITKAGEQVVIKLGVPNSELATEISALQRYGGEGVVRLLDCDADRGFLLLEGLQPGLPLASLPDDAEATRIAARVMRSLWRPAPPGHPFSTLRDWARGLGNLRKRFDGGTGPLPARMVEMAESFFAELLDSAELPPVLLHGDLHHENILSATRQPWLAIDPKGVAGEMAYDTAALLENPSPDRYSNVAIQRTRISILSEELGLDAQRIVRYGVAHCVLSAWWCIEDGDDGWTRPLACAEVLEQIL